MKKLLTLIALFALPLLASAQIENPVRWNFMAKKINGNKYELHLTATIEGGWHMYAQQAGEGPVPTSFKFNGNPLVTLSGKVKEVGKLRTSFDKTFNSQLRYYENQVDFVQVVVVKGKAATKVKGRVEFMVCDDHQCLPAKDIDFAIGVGGM